MVAKSLQHDTALQTFEAILRYLMSVSTITRDQLRASYTRGVSKQPLLTEGLSIMPTIAEQLKQEGLEQGLERGRTEGALIGRIQTLAEMLGRSIGSFEELSARDESELRQLAEELKAAVDQR
jgi:flagellar biosynthesis/type III secretory pathway protein FliH